MTARQLYSAPGLALTLLLWGCSGTGPDGGTGGASTGSGGANAGTGGDPAGSGGLNAGTGGDPTGSGGLNAASGGANAGTGGDPTGSGGSAGDPTVPSDTSQAGLEAWLATQSYRNAPWVGEATPRSSEPPMGEGGPHGIVRVFYNPTGYAGLQASKADPNAAQDHPVGAMAVKELYDSNSAQIGTAILLRLTETGDFSDWLYYCSSTGAGSCTTGAAPGAMYGTGDLVGTISSCTYCHTGSFWAPLPR